MLKIEAMMAILAQQEPQPFSFGDMLPFLLLIFAAFYFILIRPQRKAENERKQLLHSLEKGDEVQTIGGILGTVLSIDQQNNVITIEVDKNSKLKVTRTAISSVEKKKKKAGKQDQSQRG